MLLTGKYLRSLDDKQRFAIPKPLRDELGHPEVTVMYVAPGTDGSLALYTQDSFSQMGDQLASTSPTQQDVRDFSRMFYAQAQRVEMDKQGRVRIPADLASFASLQKEIVLLGVRDHLEIWDNLHWDAYLLEKQRRYDQIAENAFGNQSAPTTAPPELLSGTPTPPRPR